MPGMSDATAPPEVRDMPLQLREMQLVPGSFNEADNTVGVVWTSGALVRRYDYWNDTPYDEELVVTLEAVDMSRFEAGAVPVLDSHSRWSLSTVMGAVKRAWLENGLGQAVLQLSQRASMAEVVGDIKAGIIRNISAGYNVSKFQIVPPTARTDGGTVPLYRAIRWQPAELSFVPIGADMSAGTRNDPAAQQQPHQRSQAAVPCEFIRAEAQHSLETHMPEPVKEGAAAPTNEQREAELTAARQAAESAAVTRAAEITALCVRAYVPNLAEALIRSGKTVEAAGLAILEERAAEDFRSGGHRNTTKVTTERDETETQLRGIEEAVHQRVNPKAELTDNGRQYRGMSMLELGRDYLESRGVNTRGWDRLRLATEMLHFRSPGMVSTSDLSNVLANVATKRLRQAYEENPGTYRRWARRAPNAPDFKSLSVVQLSAMPDLLQINEHGEFKYGAVSDGAETYALLTYGRILAVTRQALINDDLRAFDRMNTGFGSASARLENRTVYAQLTANANMSDGIALFNASHSNLGTGAPSALALGSLTTMRTAMRVQKGLQAEELNLVPSGLIVPAALEQTAYQLTSSQYTPATQATISEFRMGGRTALEPIVEPILDANSATAWYAFANNSQVDTVEYCYLDGAEGPMLESEVGFEVDGISMKARLDFAAKAIDWRGLYKANGV
jgi:hypothetical protein